MKKRILLSILSAFLGVFTFTTAYCQYNEYGGIQDAIDFAQQNDIAYSVDGVSHNGFFDGDLSSVSYKGGQAGYYNFDNQIQKGYFYFRNKNSPPKFYQGPRDRWLNVKLSAYEFVPFKNQDAVKTAISLNNLKQQEEQLNSTPQSFENFSKSADYFINTYERERQEVIQGQIGSNECGQDCGRPDSFELNDNKSDTKFTLVSTFKNKINNEFNDIVDIFKAGSRDGSAEGALFGPIKDSNKYISDLIDKDDDDEKDESCYAGVCTDITDNSKFEISFRFKSLLNVNSDINIAGLAGIGDGGIEFLNFVAETFVTINRQRTNSIILGELDPETRAIIEQQQQAKFKAKLDNIKDFIFYLSSPQFQLKKGPELLKESLNEVVRYVSGKPTVESEYKAGKFAFELLGLLFGSTEVKAALKSEAAFVKLLNRIPKGTTKKFSILDGSTNGRYILYKNDSRFPKLVNETEESFFLKAPHIITQGDDAVKGLLGKLENLTDVQVRKFDDLVEQAARKGQRWDNPEAVADAIRKSADEGIDGISVSHKKFPAPADGSDSFVLKNAKKYQAEASGDAALSFDKAGVSFDDIANGKLIDRKFGHSSVFDSTGNVANNTRAQSLLTQANRQLGAAGGNPIRWEISSQGGANGIKRLFRNNGINIEVVHVPQITIIP